MSSPHSFLWSKAVKSKHFSLLPPVKLETVKQVHKNSVSTLILFQSMDVSKNLRKIYLCL